MMVPAVLLLLGALTAVVAPRLLARADWAEREPVVALWVWQCVVVAVLLCCALSMTLSAAAAWQAVRGHVFAPAPRGVVEAYAFGTAGAWAPVTAVTLACGAVWSAAMLVREIVRARARRRHRRAELLERAPLLPGEEPGTGRLVVLESDRPEAWWLPGAAPRLVVTTAALRRLKGRQLDAVLAHEQGHARARHDWLLHCSAALAEGFPQVPVFAAFRDEMHRLVELAADDMASRRFGRLTTALALVELNEERGVFGPCPAAQAQVPQRVHRLLTPWNRLPALRRLRLTAVASLVPAVPVLVAVVPGLRALG
ncbi:MULTISPECIES: M56 family metallopeptidase [Streptomyces]|uniref:M56 family metallopeptidase n=1 Tax=Streptomyces thermoviolaceus subsp. thermoviolaceus TaxID=66860 RepID=A0ABX0YS78_STRTL|nr:MULTISPECIES: M56 family metallopeptidase [Streptomyces]MCM3262661.1 M56 family metallopeptidase [Streptomyces thermoviolaceus]NJP13920.1 M56 family metallopeptidase [Streptomyces thermoviolaceus subsp. thermoviolaceus]RSS06623.1 M56 family peptidase [Streptomyces sp. WAC00469]WTD50282.1 M56 family metallopeptidase [Streptomyces thermoviolaceus]GGV64070.1 membrane protein [Streptomyces thermoviolaceus subsp. apingens]